MQNMESKVGAVITILVLVFTVTFYMLKMGDKKFILYSDILVVVYSFIALLLGFYAVKTYTLKSLLGKSLFLIVLGMLSWFSAEFIWIIFFKKAVYFSEFLRFFGYLPLSIGFFSILNITNPSFRNNKKKVIPLFICKSEYGASITASG